MPLVVLSTARNDDLAAIGMVGDDRFERRTVPQVKRIDRLHIVMAVEQNMRACISIALTDNRRMSRRWTHVGHKADGRDIRCEMIGSLFAIVGESRIRRDRFDPEQRK